MFNFFFLSKLVWNGRGCVRGTVDRYLERDVLHSLVEGYSTGLVTSREESITVFYILQEGILYVTLSVE